MQPDVLVYFDYLCPYAWRGAEIAETVATELGVRFEWRHFSLMQSNSTDPSFQIWNVKLNGDDPSGSYGLLPFLASLAARRQGPESGDAFRLALMRARHRDHEMFSPEMVQRTAAVAGLDIQRFESDLADPELRTLLAREHHQGVQLSVFGTPTFSFLDSGDTSYLRVRELPNTRQEALDLFMTFRSLLRDYPYLETVKRPRGTPN